MPPPPIRRTTSYLLFRTLPPASAFGFDRRGLSAPAREVAPGSGSSSISPVPLGGFASSCQVLPPTLRLLDRSVCGAELSAGSSKSSRAPQLPQKFSSSATLAPHSLQAGIIRLGGVEKSSPAGYQQIIRPGASPDGQFIS